MFRVIMHDSWICTISRKPEFLRSAFKRLYTTARKPKTWFRVEGSVKELSYGRRVP
ncbi:hypothetical protein PILCRDRAFT_130667 [Piloderma croceum F 1598]|uniref:Uncharacterized protein n=1 Tax=Piloderma croceum (strain F 1598) TaxID=765440 RepID=A0A0C3GLN4_PILCF|nr:hypothetical protein PILCRDRAFT_130667 [Piloderma croceum F 1598]